jgi:hypothetical protein
MTSARWRRADVVERLTFSSTTTSGSAACERGVHRQRGAKPQQAATGADRRLRREYEMFRGGEDGIRQGKFLPVDLQLTAYGILL